MKNKNSQFTRRDFFKVSGVTLLAGAMAGFGGYHYATQIEPAWLDLVEVELTLPRLAPSFSGLRAAQITDIHMGDWMNRERLERVVSLALEQSPDIAFLTGDFIAINVWDRHGAMRQAMLDDIAAALRLLAETVPTFAVLGNHDHWANVDRVRLMLAGAGVIELSNAVHTLWRGNDPLHLAGIDDAYDGYDNLDLTMSQLPMEGATILLAHEPDFADISAATGRFDLQISGHTHGGQVILPFIGPPVLPRLGKKYPMGLYQVGDMYQYTSRGVGMTLMPIRFNCRPEVTVFTLKSEVS